MGVDTAGCPWPNIAGFLTDVEWLKSLATIEGLVIQKACVDCVLGVIWVPFMVTKVRSVGRLTCYPYWKENTCAHWVTKSMTTPSLACVVVAGVFFMVYSYLWREIRQNKSEKNANGVSGSRFFIFSYFAVFLWLHIYWSCAWIVTCFSMYFWVMSAFIVLGIIHDGVVLYRVMQLRNTCSLAMIKDSVTKPTGQTDKKLKTPTEDDIGECKPLLSNSNINSRKVTEISPSSR
ncbi:hypothetical protein AAMO2058_001321700 [Amorphochlora amoebiformis]